MSIGPDITAVFQEVGMPITITHPVAGTVVTGEYFDYDDNFYDTSTEFLRQFGVAGSFQHNSVAVPGDIINFLGTDNLIISSKPTVFEGEVVTIDAFLLICNTLGKFTRLSKSTRNTKGELVDGATDIYDNVSGCQYEQIGQTVSASDEMKIFSHTEVLYVSGYPDVKLGDRWFPDRTDSSEYRKVVKVHKRKFDGCLQIYLDTDSR